MNVNNVNINVSREDLKSIIEDVLVLAKVEGLKIYKIDYVESKIFIEGSYKFKVEIPFKGILNIEGVEKNFLRLRIAKISIAKLPIVPLIRKTALKKLLDDFMVIGIISHQDMIYVELDTVLTIVPYVTFILKEIYIEGDYLKLSLDNLQYNQDKNFIPFEEAMKKNEKIKSVRELNPEKKQEIIQVVLNSKNKVTDGYTNIRKKIEDSVSPQYKELLQYSMVIPDLISLVYRLIKDPRVKNSNKVLLGVVGAYIISPIELIPDKIPFIGKIDEITLICFALDRVLNNEDENIILENWEGKDNIIDLVRNGVRILKGIVGTDSIEKIYKYINNHLKKKCEPEAQH